MLPMSITMEEASEDKSCALAVEAIMPYIDMNHDLLEILVTSKTTE